MIKIFESDRIDFVHRKFLNQMQDDVQAKGFCSNCGTTVFYVHNSKTYLDFFTRKTLNGYICGKCKYNQILLYKCNSFEITKHNDFSFDVDFGNRTMIHNAMEYNFPRHTSEHLQAALKKLTNYTIGI
jgi:ribosomal protein S27AE